MTTPAMAAPPWAVPSYINCGYVRDSYKVAQMQDVVIKTTSMEMAGMGSAVASLGLHQPTRKQWVTASTVAFKEMLNVCTSGGVKPTAPVSLWLAIAYLQSLAKVEGIEIDPAAAGIAADKWWGGGEDQ